MSDGLRSKVLVIGLDGATFDLIWPLFKEGKLPNLAKMVDLGVHSKLYSTVLPLSPSAWTSFATGKNPGKHGVYDFSKRIEGTYKHRPTTSLDVKTNTLWDYIGSRGGRSIVINVPLTYPPKPLNGFMITGFPTPTQRGDYTYPRELLAMLKSKFGEVKIHKPRVLYRKGREEEITRTLIEITKQQAAITHYLMQLVHWNLAISVFDATDVIGHYFWAYLDKNHPKYDHKLAEPVRRMVTDVHVELDRAIGKLNESVGDDHLELAISDHGFGPVYKGVYVNNWLLEQKYMYFKRSWAVRAKYLAYRHGFHVYNLLRAAKKLRLVKSVESAYSTKSRALRLLRLISLTFDNIDWMRTRVYSYGNFGQLYVNLKGDEPEGIVSREEVDSLVKELVAKIRVLEDPENHEHMFDSIYLAAELYNGPETGAAPDVIFLDTDMKYAPHRMFELGSNRLVTPHPVYSGNHKMDGVLFMKGKGVKKIEDFPQAQINLIDLAPTILHYLGIRIPDDTDGRVLEEFFEASSDFAQRGVEYWSAEIAEVQRIRSSLRKVAMKREI